MKARSNKKWFAVLIALVGCTAAVLLALREEDELLPFIDTPPLAVETVRIARTDYRIRIPAWGLVEPSETIAVRTQISGMVTKVPPTVFAGADITQGDLLCQIDDRDYRNAVARTIAARVKARQDLEIEMGRQSIAQAEWRLLDNSKWKQHPNKALALREPQLKARQADVRMAAAQQVQAELDVQRTRITSPCSGVILEESLAAGMVLDAGDIITNIACIQRYHLLAVYAPDRYVDPQQKEVTIVIGPQSYTGEVKSILPQILDETRHRQALVVFTAQRVSLGAYAAVRLPGRVFQGVVVLPKEALRPESTVWLMANDGTLERRPVTVLGQDEENIVIKEGLADGEEVILSHIASPLEGMALQTATHQAKRRPSNADNGKDDG